MRYRIAASVTGQDLEGQETVQIDPTGAAPLSEVVLFLFPNILQKRLAGEDEKDFYWISPVRWRPGGMELLSLTGSDGAELPRTPVAVTRKDDVGNLVTLPSGTAIRVTLPESSGGPVTLHARFRVHVPERLGTFSWYDGELFLTGGWYPMVAPRDAAGRWDVGGVLPRADADVSLEGPGSQWLLLDRTLEGPTHAPRHMVTAQIRSRPQVLLIAARELHAAWSGDLELLSPSYNRYYAERITRNAMDAREFLGGFGLSRTTGPIVLHQAPLSRELVFQDAPIGVVSRRIYRIFAPFRKYEDFHVARAEIASEVRDRVYDLEPGEDAGWVLDAVAAHLAREWQKAKRPLRDVRDYVRPLAFLPGVDVVLSHPDFPFAADFYDNFYATDYVRDDISRFNNSRPNGRVALEKLAERFGREPTERALVKYLSGSREEGGFRQVMSRELGADLGAFFEEWRAPLGLVNYKLKKVALRRDADGGWISSIQVAREGAPIDEPVTVRVTTDKGEVDARWESSHVEETIDVKTPAQPRVWTLDPDSRLFETSLHDNRIPAGWRTLIQYIQGDYDFSIGRADVAAGISIERRNDLRNEVLADVFYSQESVGADIGLAHSLGRFAYFRGLLHRFGILLIGEHLDLGFAKSGLHVVPGFDSQLSDVNDTLSLQEFYRYDSRLDWRFPRRGNRFQFYVEEGASVSGRSSQYALADATWITLFPISDNQVGAVETKAGTFLGTKTANVPLAKLFYLGGIQDDRGISAPDIVGPARFLVSGELRQFLLNDLDWNLYVMRMRQIQGALFVDTGYIAPRTFDVPPVSSWVTSVGYGLRPFADFLGVSPQVFRVELSQRVDNLDLAHPQLNLKFYLSTGQTF